MDSAPTGLLSFLNRNAPAIQALASALSLVVTAILAFITWRYVQLTKAIATATARTVGLHEQTQESLERQLDILLTMIEQRLKALPEHQSHAEQIRESTIWDAQDLLDMQQLSAAEGHDPGQAVATLVGRLRWLDEQVAQVKKTTDADDWSPRFPWQRWLEELTKARSEIPVIRLDLMNVRKGYKLR